MQNLNTVINILIVDDEFNAINRLSRMLITLLEDYKIKNKVHSVNNAKAALEMIQNSHFMPHLIFLDMNMPEISGLEFLRDLKKISCDKIPQIIFQTSHAEFAINAFDENACDYLLKPFSKERLETALFKVINLLKNQENRIFAVDGLTQRENECLEYYVKGYSYKSIGKKLEISHRTVETHIQNIKMKINLDQREKIAEYVYQSEMRKN